MYPSCLWHKKCKSTNSNLKPWVALWVSSYPFLLPSDSIMAGIEWETPGIAGSTLSLIVISTQTWVKIWSEIKKSRLFLQLNGRALRRSQGCSACRAAMLASARLVSSLPEWKESMFRSMIYKIKAQLDIQFSKSNHILAVLISMRVDSRSLPPATKK